MTVKIKIAEIVRAYLEENPDLTQAQLAVMAGVNPLTLWKYLKPGASQSPDVQTMAKVMKYVGVTDFNEIYEIIEEGGE